jgi:transposase
VAQIDELFAIDAQARDEGLSQIDRHLLRLEKCKPLVDQIKTAIQATRADALPKSALAKACNYTLTLWNRLGRFLEYPELELSNNFGFSRFLRAFAALYQSFIKSPSTPPLLDPVRQR